jgi:hypothetical protein
LTSTNLLTRNSSIVFKGKQHINRVFITNLVITIVTNDMLAKVGVTIQNIKKRCIFATDF